MELEIPQELSGDLESLGNIEVEFYPQHAMRKRFEETTTRTDLHKTSDVQSVAYHSGNRGRPSLFQTTIDQAEESADSEDGEVQRSYQDLLIRCPDSAQLIQKFAQVRTKLRESSANGVDFSLAACYHRLAAGHDIQIGNLQNITLEDYRVFATPEGLEFKQRSTSKCFVHFTQMCGVLVGSGSSGFRALSDGGLDLKTYNYEDVDCLTLITDINSFDIASDSEVIKYDLYLFCAWQISSKSAKTSIVPLTKQQLAVVKIKMKLRAMAEAKCLFVNELWLLAILKTLCLQPPSAQNAAKVQKVKRLLDSKFELSQKMYRIACWMKPKNFFLSKALRDKQEDRERITKLQQKIAVNFSKRQFGRQQLLLDWRVIQSSGATIARSLGDVFRQKGFMSRKVLLRSHTMSDEPLVNANLSN